MARVAGKLSSKVLKKENVHICLNTVKKIEQLLRKPISRLQNKDIYDLQCKCYRYYIGQTGRNIICKLQKRSKGRRTGSYSVVEQLHQNGQLNIKFDEGKTLAKMNNTSSVKISPQL